MGGGGGLLVTFEARILMQLLSRYLTKINITFRLARKVSIRARLVH